MIKAMLAELFDHFGQILCHGTEVRVDFRPSGCRGSFDIFRAFAVRQAHGIGQGIKSGSADLQRCQVPSSSMVRILRKISRSFFGLLKAGINMPKIYARTRTSGLRPHH